MNPVRSICILLSLWMISTAESAGQTTASRTASISGRVTVTGQAANRIAVTVHRQEPRPSPDDPDAEGWTSVVQTDSEGRYSVTGLAAGRYVIKAGNFIYVSEGPSRGIGFFEQQAITLGEAEERTGYDFRLVRGSVVTGVVTDGQGKPVIERNVSLQSFDENRQGGDRNISFGHFRTDDRGVYRIYGARAGRYLISVGGEESMGDGDRIAYPRTFAPGTTDEKQAAIVELKQGEEVTEINIRLGETSKGFDVLGRVIEEDSGKPVRGLIIFCMNIGKEEAFGMGGGGQTQVDEQGNFRFQNLTPGTYQALATNIEGIFTGESTPYYVEPTTFEVGTDEPTKVVIKAKRGATVSGVAILDVGVDPALKGKLQQMMLTGEVQPGGQGDGEHVMDGPGAFSRISADGSFRFSGVRPGKLRIEAQGMGGGSPLLISRIEHKGVVVNEGVQVTGSDAITDLRIVFTRGTCVIRGEVRIIGGQLPNGQRTSVHATRAIGSGSPDAFTDVDEKGRFTLQGLVPGEYTLTLFSRFEGLRDSGQPPPAFHTVHQKVTVTSGAEVPVTMTLDLGKKAPEDRQ